MSSCIIIGMICASLVRTVLNRKATWFPGFHAWTMGRLLVVLACTLAGGVERASFSNDTHGNNSCSAGTRWGECNVLDSGVTPEHIWTPWAVLLGTILVLNMPTVLLRSTNKEKGLSMVAWVFIQCLGLMAVSLFATDHPSLQFTLSLHAIVRLLEHMDTSPPLCGGWLWWETRHLVVLCLLLWEVLLGPPISIIRWPGSPEALQCSYLAHLAGAILPDCAMLALRWVQRMGRCVNLRDD